MGATVPLPWLRWSRTRGGSRIWRRPIRTCGDDSITRAGFDAAANRLARDLQARGVGLGDMVTIALPDSIAWFVTAAAACKLGAIPQPMSYGLPDAELREIVELADSKVVVGAEPERLPGRTALSAHLGAEPAGEATRQHSAALGRFA